MIPEAVHQNVEFTIDDLYVYASDGWASASIGPLTINVICPNYTYFDAVLNECTQDICTYIEIQEIDGSCSSCPDYSHSSESGLECETD
jgi:hypothetical protein